MLRPGQMAQLRALADQWGVAVGTAMWAVLTEWLEAVAAGRSRTPDLAVTRAVAEAGAAFRVVVETPGAGRVPVDRLVDRERVRADARAAARGEAEGPGLAAEAPATE